MSKVYQKILQGVPRFLAFSFAIIAGLIVVTGDAHAAGALSSLLGRTEVANIMLGVCGILAFIQLALVLVEVAQGDWTKAFKLAFTIAVLVIIGKYWKEIVEFVPI